MASGGLGTLHLVIHSVKLKSSQDAYVKIGFTGASRPDQPLPTSLRTATKANTKEADFFEHFTVSALELPGGATVDLTVMDWDRMTSDDELAKFAIPAAMIKKGFSYKTLVEGKVALKASAAWIPFTMTVPATGTLLVKLVRFHLESNVDAYANVTLRGGLEAPDFEGYKTEKADNGDKGTWDEYILLPHVTAAALDAELKVQVMDWDRFSSDDEVGTVAITFADFCGGIMSQWFEIRDDEGEFKGRIELSVQWTPASA